MSSEVGFRSFSIERTISDNESDEASGVVARSNLCLYRVLPNRALGCPASSFARMAVRGNVCSDASDNPALGWRNVLAVHEVSVNVMRRSTEAFREAI